MSVNLLLLGDSVFDNGIYVGPNGKPVRRHLEELLPAGSRVTMFALDGSMTDEIERQVHDVKSTGATDFTHVVVSVGGNDGMLQAFERGKESGLTVRDLEEIGEWFRPRWSSAIRYVIAEFPSAKVAACTIYSPPQIALEMRVGVRVLNDILRLEALGQSCQVIELRRYVFDRDQFVRTIEPSHSGGRSVAMAVAEWAMST